MPSTQELGSDRRSASLRSLRSRRSARNEDAAADSHNTSTTALFDGDNPIPVIEPVVKRAAWFRSIKTLADVFISVELTSTWYLHLVYAKKDGEQLRGLFTQRFAALTTMISLLVASQVAVLFSPSKPTDTARTALKELNYGEVGFWAGLFLCISMIFAVLALLATLSAWTLFNSIGSNNAHIILRSSMCLHAATLPIRLAVLSIYSFFVWMNIFWFVIADPAVGSALVVLFTLMGIYIVATYSAVGRTIMYSGALSNERILEHDEEDELTGREMATLLVERTIIAKEGKIPVEQQYRIKYQEQLDILEEGGSLQLTELLLPEFQEDNIDDDLTVDEEEGNAGSNTRGKDTPTKMD